MAATGTQQRDERPYRPNVGALLMRASDNKILLARRLDGKGNWQFPQGGIEEGEEIEEALWREIGEELGLSAPREVCDILGHGPATAYDFPEGGRMSRRYRGQRQTLFVLEFTGADEDIQLDAFEEPEFGEFAWFGLEETLELVWSVKREILEATMRALPEVFEQAAS